MTRRRVFVHDMRNMLGIIIGYSNMLLDEIQTDDPRRLDIQEICRAGEGALALLENWSIEAPGEDAT